MLVNSKEDVRKYLEDIWDWFALNYAPLFVDMMNCDHGTEGRLNPYHEEGNVLTHTKMVFEECVKRAEADFSENQLFNYERWMMCAVACICHDFGKPSTRKEFTSKDGIRKVNFIGHEMMSACLAYEPVRKYLGEHSNFINEEVFKNIIFVIIEHTKVFKVEEGFKYDSFEMWQLFKDLGECDHNGRICSIEGNYKVPDFNEDDICDEGDWIEPKDILLTPDFNADRYRTWYSGDSVFIDFGLSRKYGFHIKKERNRKVKELEGRSFIIHPYYSFNGCDHKAIVRWCQQFTMPYNGKQKISILIPSEFN